MNYDYKNLNPHTMQEEKHPEMRIFCMITYVFSSIGAIFQSFQSTVIIGVLILFVTYMMCKAQKFTSQGTIYQSHVEWNLATIKIGMFFLFPIAILFALYFVWTDTGLAQVVQATQNSEDAGDSFGGIINWFSSRYGEIERITTNCMIPPLLWWMRRTIVGYLRARESEPIDFPGSLI